MYVRNGMEGKCWNMGSGGSSVASRRGLSRVSVGVKKTDLFTVFLVHKYHKSYKITIYDCWIVNL